MKFLVCRCGHQGVAVFTNDEPVFPEYAPTKDEQ